MLVPFAEIDPKFRPASEVRSGISRETVEVYREVFSQLPPVRLVYDPKRDVHLVADGRHRLEAARELGRTDVFAVVTTGSYIDAHRQACHANDQHGLRATNADKKHRVKQALAHPEMSGWSDRRIADQCGVSHPFVGDVRAELTGNGFQLGADSSPAAVVTNQPNRLGKDDKIRSHPRPRKTEGREILVSELPKGDDVPPLLVHQAVPLPAGPEITPPITPNLDPTSDPIFATLRDHAPIDSTDLNVHHSVTTSIGGEIEVMDAERRTKRRVEGTKAFLDLLLECEPEQLIEDMKSSSYDPAELHDLFQKIATAIHQINQAFVRSGTDLKFETPRDDNILRGSARREA